MGAEKGEAAPAPGFRRKHKRRCRDITAQHRLNSMEMHRLSSASGLAKGAGSGYNKPVVQSMLAALRACSLVQGRNLWFHPHSNRCKRELQGLLPQIQEKTSVRRKKAHGGLFSGVEGGKCLGKLGRPERPRKGVMRRWLCRAAEHRADHIRPCGMTAAGTGGRTLCAPTEEGEPNRWDCTKGGRVRPLLGSTPNKGPVVAALYKGGCVGAAMSRPPFRFSALSVGAGPRPARRIAGKPDAGKKSLAGEWYLFPRGMGQGNIGRIISAPVG